MIHLSLCGVTLHLGFAHLYHICLWVSQNLLTAASVVLKSIHHSFSISAPCIFPVNVFINVVCDTSYSSVQVTASLLF